MAQLKIGMVEAKRRTKNRGSGEMKRLVLTIDYEDIGSGRDRLRRRIQGEDQSEGANLKELVVVEDANLILEH